MSWYSFFTGISEVSDGELPTLFPLSIASTEFVKADVLATYEKILTDVIERTDGIPSEIQPLMFDNCVQSESSEGLITLLAKAMTDKQELFLVYDDTSGVLRRATPEETKQIKDEYKSKAGSDVGIYVSFVNYKRTKMVEIYSALEYCVLCSLNKTLGLSKAIQVKIAELRSSVALMDSSIARAQAKSIAGSLAAGKDVVMDAKDEIATANPDTSSTEKAIEFLDSKRAYYLGMPMSYITGLQTGGIGSTGEADTKAVERGLKNYFVAIIHPVLEALFEIDTDFETEDYRGVATALEALKTFELVSDDFLSREAKQKIAARMFGLDDEEELANIEKDKTLPERVHPTEQVTAGKLASGVAGAGA